MNNKRRIPFIFIALCIALAAFATVSQAMSADEEKLLEAWEELLRADPKTEALKKTSPMNYRFKTSTLPYDGPLVIKDVLIDDSESFLGETYRMGYIKIDLPGLPEGYMENHSHRYSMVTRHGTLAFDHDTGKWLSWNAFLKRGYANREDEDNDSADSILELFNITILVVLFIAAMLLFFKSRKSMSTAVQLNQDQLEQMKQTNQLLQELIRELKNR